MITRLSGNFCSLGKWWRLLKESISFFRQNRCEWCFKLTWTSSNEYEATILRVSSAKKSRKCRKLSPISSLRALVCQSLLFFLPFKWSIFSCHLVSLVAEHIYFWPNVILHQVGFHKTSIFLFFTKSTFFGLYFVSNCDRAEYSYLNFMKNM